MDKRITLSHSHAKQTQQKRFLDTADYIETKAFHLGFSYLSHSKSPRDFLSALSLCCVYAPRSSLASKFIVALLAFSVYYYCGSCIHSYFLSFFHPGFVYFINVFGLGSLSLSHPSHFLSFCHHYRLVSLFSHWLVCVLFIRI